MSRTRLFDLIRAGEVDARKIGRRTVIIADSLRAYIAPAPRRRLKRNRPVLGATGRRAGSAKLVATTRVLPEQSGARNGNRSFLVNLSDQSDPTRNGGFLKFWHSRHAFFRDAREALDLGPLIRPERVTDDGSEAR